MRRKEDGSLEHTTDALAFYEVAYLEEFEPIMIDLLEYGRAMGLRISHADAEDKSQVEVNQAAGLVARRTSTTSGRTVSSAASSRGSTA